VIVTLDSDGEDRAEDVPRLVKEVLDTDTSAARVVVAKRTKRAYAPLAFRLAYPCFKLFFLLATGTAVESGNLAAYRARTAKRILLHPSFLLCYSSALLTMNLPITFVDCERGARYGGSSRMGYSQLFTHAMRMLMPFSEADRPQDLVGIRYDSHAGDPYRDPRGRDQVRHQRRNPRVGDLRPGRDQHPLARFVRKPGDSVYRLLPVDRDIARQPGK
jgi:hypothetical protein